MNSIQDSENHSATASFRRQLSILKKWEKVRKGEEEFEKREGEPLSFQIESFLKGNFCL